MDAKTRDLALLGFLSLLCARLGGASRCFWLGLFLRLAESFRGRRKKFENVAELQRAVVALPRIGHGDLTRSLLSVCLDDLL
jgi:hypothetical protein